MDPTNRQYNVPVAPNGEPADTDGGPGHKAPPFDPDLAVYLQHHAEALGPSRITPAMIEPLRRQRSARPRPDPSRGGRYSVREMRAKGVGGLPDVPLLVCRPAAAVGPIPLLVFVHGGGFVFHDRYTGGFPMAQDWIEDLPVAIASVEYRRPPEHPHPAPLDDCLTALRWIHAHCEEIGAEPDHLILAGISAGGGIAAATALANADQNQRVPMIPLRGLILHAPMLDDRCESVSMRTLTGVGTVERVTCQTG